MVAFFGSEGLYAFDLDGNLLWKQDIGALDQGAFDVPDYKWGNASSPILYKNRVIVQCDQQKGSFIAAFDSATGKRVWQTEREGLPSWSTPTVHEGRDRAELVTNGTEYFRGYDPDTGRELWRIKGTSMISVPTPFVAHNLIYLASGYFRFIQPIVALRPGSAGDVKPEAIAWRTIEARRTSPRQSSTAITSMFSITGACSRCTTRKAASAFMNNASVPGAPSHRRQLVRRAASMPPAKTATSSS